MKNTIYIFTLLLGSAILFSCNKESILDNVLPTSPPSDDFSYEYASEGIIKAEMGKDAYFILFEELSPLEHSPGNRYLKKIAFDGAEILRLSGQGLIDFCRSDQALFALYSSIDRIQIIKYDLNGTPQSTKVIWENSSNASFQYNDRGRMAIHHNTLLVAIRPEDYSTRLYSLKANDLEIKWSQLVEPAQDILGHGMTGGSYDTFEQLAHPYMVFLDLDENGNAYVAVPALYSSTIYWHNQHFGENLSHVGGSHVSLGLETDALVTKISSTGERMYTIVAGSADPDECYGIKANNSSFYLYGRTGVPTSTIGYAWNAYIAKYNSATGTPVFVENLDIDQSEIIYDIAEMNTGDLILVGSAGWTQNPLGYSVSGTARKLVAIVGPSGNFKEEIEMESGLRHNQVRSIIYGNNRIWLGGWENGPGTHTGDSDPNLVFADAFWESYSLH